MKVFINYSSKDEALATQIVETLEEAGLDAWYKRREVFPGDNWAQKIAEGLRESNAMVVLVTPDALESDAVRDSISYALGKPAFSRRLIPVIVDDSNLLTDKTPWILKRLHIVKLSKDGKNEAQFKKIAQAWTTATAIYFAFGGWDISRKRISRAFGWSIADVAR